MKKRTQKSLKKEADDLASKITRSYGKCEKCGSTLWLQAAHIYSRRFNATRHDLSNLLCLCASCHRWGHDKPLDFARWVESYIGGDIVNELSQKAHKISPKHDFEPTVIYLREIWEKMK